MVRGTVEICENAQLNQLFENSLSHNSPTVTKLWQLEQPKLFPYNLHVSGQLETEQKIWTCPLNKQVATNCDEWWLDFRELIPHPFGTCAPQNQVHRGKLCFLWSLGTVLCHMTLLHTGLLGKNCSAITQCHFWNDNNLKTTSFTYLCNKQLVLPCHISHHSTSLGFFRCSHKSPHKTLCWRRCWARLLPTNAHQSMCC